MNRSLDRALDRWQSAGLLAADAAERIRRFERGREPGTPGRLAPLAFALGGVLLGAGVLLFVAAHWATLAPGARFGLVLLLVGGFHAAGAGLAARAPALATTLHAVGTAALGAGIYLAGQIFNLGANWPAALLLWAVGAAAGVALLRDWPQVAWTAVLVPAWLVAEWHAAWARHVAETLLHVPPFWLPAGGLLLYALACLAAGSGQDPAPWRRALVVLGALALLPAAVAAGTRWGWAPDVATAVPLALWAAGGAVAAGVPLALAAWLRGRHALWLLAGVAWLLAIQATAGPADRGALQHLLYAAGALALVAWGVHERRALLVNLGVAGFALAVLVFYFSSVLDKLGRSAGLVGLGLLFIAGGWLLERTRRRLLARMATP